MICNGEHTFVQNRPGTVRIQTPGMVAFASSNVAIKQESGVMGASIHGQERNATFPFPESCPIFLERDRTAVPIRKGGKEWERKGD